MNNGTTVSFSSNNPATFNGKKEYLVFHHRLGEIRTIGVAYYANGFWNMGQYRFKLFRELKAVIRHKYTGSHLPDIKESV